MARHPSTGLGEIPASFDLVGTPEVTADEVRPWIVPGFLIAFVFVGALWIRVEMTVGWAVIATALLGLAGWAVLRRTSGDR
jgi:hypothetical protein